MMNSIWFSDPYQRKGRKKWYFDYRDANGKTHKGKPGYRDKQATKTLIRTMQTEEEQIAAGSPRIASDRRQAPLKELVTVWADNLAALGRSNRHVTDVKICISRLIHSTGWSNLASISVETLTAFLSALHAKGMAPRTLNWYRAVLWNFLSFCVRQGWLHDNPIRNHQPARSRKVRHRRAFTLEEFSRLTQGRHGLVYLIAGLSGFRRNEMSLMEKQDITPDADCARWHPRSEIVKSRRKEITPMHPDIVPALRTLWESLPNPTSRLFPKMPKEYAFQTDLTKAGIATIDDAGRHADFHSFRYTYCTFLSKSLPMHRVKDLMRHKDIRMTDGIYRDLGLTDLFDTVKALPSILLPPALPASEKTPKTLAFSQNVA